MIDDFKGKTAVLTGAGSGFGLECARIGARLGMNLVLVDVQQDALDAAAAEMRAAGSQVTVAAESFGQEPTQGTLLAATRTRYTLRREDPRAGTVHVHFPRIGYVLRKAEQ